ncbi:unnamed protein product [Timema podura]|uniref:Uncharacterized protein n=1 Tax=Timema podura TaxID=61482 RepID=A0ABN7PNU0_TIMPD|nr:unnamed protein product [Timema podura]
MLPSWMLPRKATLPACSGWSTPIISTVGTFRAATPHLSTLQLGTTTWKWPSSYWTTAQM